MQTSFQDLSSRTICWGKWRTYKGLGLGGDADRGIIPVRQTTMSDDSGYSFISIFVRLPGKVLQPLVPTGLKMKTTSEEKARCNFSFERESAAFIANIE